MTPALTVAYDANGNTLSDAQGRSFTWDFENRLIRATNPGVGTTTFKYDPFGRRIQKSGPLGTTNYLYDGVNSLEKVDNGGNVSARYTQTRGIDEPLSELRSGTTSYYDEDGLGSVTSLSNGSGALANTYSYDSFGNLTTSTGTITSPFRYTARELDSETGIYEYRARYFDPTVGRFISEDPFRFAAGMNFFAYVHNNPLGLADPTGLCDKNCQLSISCGATPNTQGFSHCTVTVQNGPNYTAYDGEPSGWWLWSTLVVQHGKGVPPGPNSFVKNVDVPCDCAQNAANDINSSNMVYSAPFQNSNTAAATIAADCGVYPGSWPSGAWGSGHGPIGVTPPVNSNPWSPFNPWPPMQ